MGGFIFGWNKEKIFGWQMKKKGDLKLSGNTPEDHWQSKVLTWQGEREVLSPDD